MLGSSYQVVFGNYIITIYGTSASAPVFAGLVSLVNAIRSAEGRPPIGFLNPTLYLAGMNKSQESRFIDIVSGSNNCCGYSGSDSSQATCCASGFSAGTGWDPVSGWGSIQFPNFVEIFSTALPVSVKSVDDDVYGMNLTLKDYVVVVTVIGSILILTGFTYMCYGVFCNKPNRNGEVATKGIVPRVVMYNPDSEILPITLSVPQTVAIESSGRIDTVDNFNEPRRGRRIRNIQGQSSIVINPMYYRLGNENEENNTV